MGHQISGQLLVFGQSVLLGLCAALVYDLLRPFRLRLPRFAAVLDAGYSLIVGAAGFLFVLERGGGELRGFMLLGAAGGAVLFFCVCSRALRPVLFFWADTIELFVKLLLLPAKRFQKFCRKMIAQGKKFFYFARKCYTIRKIGVCGHSAKEAPDNMGKTRKKARPGAGMLTTLLLVVLLGAIGWRLCALHTQVEDAQEKKAQLEALVAEQERENAALEADIAQGPTSEKLEDLARDELGLVKPGEYVFDTGN